MDEKNRLGCLDFHRYFTSCGRVIGYKFGTTIVPFSDADLDAMKYKSDGKCFQVLGFADKHQVKRHEFSGDGVHYVMADPNDNAGCVAFSALVKGLKETESVGIARYCYNIRSNPRLGMIIPDSDLEGADVLVWVQIPFEEDYRWYKFPLFEGDGSHWSEPNGQQLKLMDDLIESMDLSRSKVDADGNRVEAVNPEEVIDPQKQYIFQCLQSRALYSDPLPPPEGNFLAQLDPPTEAKNLGKPSIFTINRAKIRKN